MRYSLLLVALLWIGCAAPKPNYLSGNGLIYQNDSTGIRLALPKMPGWQTTLREKDSPLPESVVFGGVHGGKLINVLLSVEAMNSDLVDYMLIIREANTFMTRPGYEDLGESDTTLQGQPAHLFRYQADVEVYGDSTEYHTYIYTNVLLKHEEYNIWLEISVRREAYDRRLLMIQEVLQGMTLFPPLRPKS
ncbi:MAG: hypothetical protein A2293_13410 [Elusimicrobia bacterium RIFOXYB2_FULL_49_7]|nr:MAG: hypothetical protein A2293_13410 [Elusimicrobia bacterium RIFOXYB2_FULL_49_7]